MLKNYKNRLRLTKVIVKNKLPRFYGSLCIYSVPAQETAKHAKFG